MSSDDAGKVMAGLSYFSVLFILPYLFRNKDRFAMYHARQGMILFVACLVGELVGGLFHLGWLVWLARIYMIIQGVSHVVKGEKKPLPFIGDLIK